MNEDDGILAEVEQRSHAVVERLEGALLKAVGTVEDELARVVRNGEADLDRLARLVAETLARVAIDGALGQRPAGGEPGGSAGSANQIAAAVARAARRGARFS